MKIGFVVDRYPEYSTTFINNQIKGLESRGHEIVVFSKKQGRSGNVEGLNVSDVYYLRKSPKSAIFRILLFVALFGKLLILKPKTALQYINCRGVEESFLSPSFFINIYDLLWLELDAFVCHFGQNGALIARLTAKGILSAPVMTMFHGYDLREGLKRGGHIYRHLFKFGEKLIAPSDYTRNLLLRFGAEKNSIVKLRTTVDLDVFRDAKRSNGKLRDSQDSNLVKILSVGRLEEIKGFDTALRAIARLRNTLSDASLRFEYSIVGDGSEEGRLKALANELGIEDCVRFYGRKETGEVASLMSESSLLLLSSRDETIPTVIVEAFAAGLPVVASDVGAVSEMIQEGKNGFVVKNTSPEGFGRALQEAVEPVSKLKELAAGIDESFVAEFDIDQTAQELETLCLQSVLNKK